MIASMSSSWHHLLSFTRPGINGSGRVLRGRKKIKAQSLTNGENRCLKFNKIKSTGNRAFFMLKKHLHEVRYVAKLSDRQRKQIIAEYVAGDGKVSIRALAKKYSVSPSSISKILGDEKSVQKCTHKKKENELSMLAFLDSRTGKAQEIIEAVLSTFDSESLKKASVRDRAGLVKILAETFGGKKEEKDGSEEKGIEIVIKDCSHEEDNRSE